MKKIALGLTIMAASALIALGGESYSGKEAKEVVPPPCPEWYGDTEWNVGIWGAYAFTSENWQDDRYLETDHAWGGGIDLKYFFNRYFGVGVEGFGLKANRRSLDLFEDESSLLEPEPLRETTARWFAENVAELSLESSLRTVLDTYASAGSVRQRRGHRLTTPV